MLVRMKTHIGGYRDGLEWPDKGGTIDVPAHEAVDLIAAGYAEGVPDGPHEDSGADPGTEPAADSGPSAEPDTDVPAHEAAPAEDAKPEDVTIAKPRRGRPPKHT